MALFNRKRTATDEPALDLRGDDVIDLTNTEPVAAKPEWGFPTRCPDCGEHGYLDRIDVVHEIMFQHCPSCWVRWETPRSETIDA